MNINNGGILENANLLPSKAHSGPFKEPPTLLVMHYTASGPGALNDATHFARRDKTEASAHLIVGRDGEIFQSVSLLNIAHHAGRSMWRGRTRCNQFSIGIEVDNWGGLTYDEHGQYRAWPGTIVKEDLVFQGRHKNGGDIDAWERYLEQQLLVLDEVVEEILKTYPWIVDVVGHDDIAPKRKTDPGPAFPLKRYQDFFSRACDDEPIRREVWVNSLNVRVEPSIGAAMLDWGPLQKGQGVNVLVDAGDWSYIETSSNQDTETKEYTGWVFDKYLR